MKKKRKNSKQFNKKFKKSFFTVKSALIIGLTVIIVLLLGLGGVRQSKQAARYQETISELSSEIKELEEKNKELEEEKDDVDSKESKERIAREKLGMIDKDEYTLKESEGQEVDSDSAGTEATEEDEKEEAEKQQ